MNKFAAGWRPSPALLVCCLALLVAFSDYASALPGINGVASDDIAPGAVRRADVAANAINGARVADGSLSAVDVGGTVVSAGPAAGDLTDTYPNPRIASAVIGSAKLGARAVRAADFGPISTISRESGPVASGTTGSAFIQCPPGTLVVGGGGEASRLAFMALNRRSGDNGWRYDAYPADVMNPVPATVTVFAYCLG